MIRSISWAIALAAIFTSTSALAQEASEAPPREAPVTFAARGQIMVSANRLIPLFSYSSYDAHRGDVCATSKATTLSLLGSPFGGGQTLYDIPRLGFDFAIADHVTLGGDFIAFATLGASTTLRSGAQHMSRDDD